MSAPAPVEQPASVERPVPVVRLNPVIAGREVDSRDRAELRGVDGQVVAEIGLAPRLLAQAAVHEVRAHAATGAPGAEVFAAAGRLFATATLDGESPGEYQRRVALATGSPRGTVERATAGIRSALARIEELNAAELPAPFAEGAFARHWVPRGQVLAVVVPNNHPEPNVTWVRALSLGYSVLLRPGSKDPFTPRRLTAALLAAGLDAHRLAFLPGGHDLGDHLLDQADLGIVYGGPDAAARYGNRRDILVRGPGRSKALVDADSAAALAESLTSWIADDGGVRCNNISAVLTSGDVGALANALAERLAALPPLPVTAAQALLPATTQANAEALGPYLAGLAAQGTDHSSARYPTGPLTALEDTSVVMRPLVISVDDPHHPLVGTELPFPFVVVAPWDQTHGTAPLRNSLVVSLSGRHTHLAEQLLHEPSVRKVTTGDVRPWLSRPELPHDGSLAGFLLEPKALIRPA
ncbi:aldehyde dehydrogenase family protein [Streptomyces sp. AN091965]|uniref:aldehyde dehydrogenase family protein n=1 Tax=Streptomyces sp. AN091965 TaxID=2927803 RepID=UPI001F614118|nr:aldehyde dehydrogenase family protein [Streptomyces sp. AN091965]MCI3927759.1 aldehyde dehydrogenase family protein [Streptomyces sp. AN091965]